MNEAAQSTQSSGANQLELNKGDNFIFGVDVSGSMETADCPGGMKRIEYLKEKVQQFATEASKWDEDGIDILSFGHQVKAFEKVTAEKANEVISKFRANESSTFTHELIKQAYALHKKGGYAQTVLFIATDGDPADRDALKREIVAITNDVKDEREFNIAFLTVGNIDNNLRDFLTGLDDDLKGAKYDIVDVKALDEVDFMQAFAGALND